MKVCNVLKKFFVAFDMCKCKVSIVFRNVNSRCFCPEDSKIRSDTETSSSTLMCFLGRKPEFSDQTRDWWGKVESRD